MPHLTIEFSSNILEKDDFYILFPKCHKLLVETLPTNLNSCKSRAIEHNLYFVGNGHKDNAFIHADLRIMIGRSTDILKEVTHDLLELLKDHFSASLSTLSLEITIEISELQNNYVKHRST